MADVRKAETRNVSIIEETGADDATYSPKAGRISLQGNLGTVEERPIITDTFTTTLDARTWSTVVAGSGAFASLNGEEVLQTGVTANSSVALLSVLAPSFKDALSGHFRAIIRLGGTTNANNNRRWGMFDANNGVFFRENNGSIVGVLRKATVDTTVTLTPTQTADLNYHIYEIDYSSAEFVFRIDGIVVGSVTLATTTTRTASLDLPVRFENINTGGGTADVTLNIREMSFGMRGESSVPQMSASAKGLRPYFNPALSNTKQAARTSPTRLYGYHIINPGAAIAYVQFFDLASGAVTVGTTTPYFALGIPSNVSAIVGVDSIFDIPIEFNTAMTIAATTTPTGSTAPATALVATLLTAWGA